MLPSLAEPPAVRRANGTVMPAEWRDPDDAAPSAARTARTVRGFRGFDPLRRCMARHGDRCGIELRHIAAADLLRAAADGAAIGFTGSARDGLPVSSIVYRPISGPSRAMQRQAACWRVLVRALAIFTADQRQLLTACVLMNVSAERHCRERREAGLPGNPGIVMGQLIACLDLLAEHFGGEVEDAIGRGLAA